jgi:hypothetical protein
MHCVISRFRCNKRVIQPENNKNSMSFSEEGISHLSEPIDAVITWVNGDDPLHQEKLIAYLKSIGNSTKAASSTRFRETGEFEFCVASLLRFAPWLRHIYIVTDAQEPSFLATLSHSKYAQRIKIVDHKVIYTGFEEYLPTFNSRSIVSMLWRIPDLAEQFLILNDDLMLLRPVSPDAFFLNGKIVVRGNWKTQHRYRLTRLFKRLYRLNKRDYNDKQGIRPGNRVGQADAAALAGYRKNYFLVPHHPHPVLKSMLSGYFSSHPDILQKNIRFRLRSAEQFLTESLALHLAFSQNKAVINNTSKTMMLKMNKISLLWLKLRLAIADKNTRVAFACIQSLDMAKPETREYIIKWLEKRVGRLANAINK